MVQYIEGHCPNCGRPIRIRTQYFGKKLVCKTCDFRFRPAPPEDLPVEPDSLPEVLEKADLEMDPRPEGTAPAAPRRTPPTPLTDRELRALLERHDPLEAEFDIKPSSAARANEQDGTGAARPTS
jgi:hypothetical protein